MCKFFPVILLCLLSVLDFIFTIKGLLFFGREFESNPIAGYLWDVGGIFGIFCLKFLTTSFVVRVYFLTFNKKKIKTAYFLIYFAVALNLYAVIIGLLIFLLIPIID